jgi:hypothetical protein
MHIPKLLALFCLAALSVGSLQAQNPDDPAQNRSWNNLPPAPSAQEAQPSMVAMNASPQTMPSATPAKTLTPEEEANLRAALRKSIADAKAAEPVASAAATTPPPKTTPAPTPAPAKAPTATPTDATPPPAAKPATQPAAVTPPPAAVPAATVTPAPAPGSKGARLKELEDKYKAGQLTAVEYQAQRAAIRAEK